MDGDDIVAFESCAQCRLVEPGEVIYRQGDAAAGVFVIREGLVGLRRFDASGEAVLLRLCRPGDTLGYREVLLGDSYRNNAEVLERGRVCCLGADAMHALLARRPELGHELLLRTARELIDAEERFVQTVSLSVRERLANLLLVLIERYDPHREGGPISVSMPLSRSDMASMIGVRPESLSRTIRQMTDEGLFSFSGRHVRIHDLTRLVDTAFPSEAA